MAHFAGEKLMPLLGLLAAGHVQEDAVGQSHVNGRGVANAARGDPPDRLANHDAEIDLIGTDDGSGCDEGRTHALAIKRVHMGRKVLEGDTFARWQVPQCESPLVHRKLVVRNVP